MSAIDSRRGKGYKIGSATEAVMKILPAALLGVGLLLAGCSSAPEPEGPSLDEQNARIDAEIAEMNQILESSRQAVEEIDRQLADVKSERASLEAQEASDEKVRRLVELNQLEAQLMLRRKKNQDEVDASMTRIRELEEQRKPGEAESALADMLEPVAPPPEEPAPAKPEEPLADAPKPEEPMTDEPPPAEGPQPEEPTAEGPMPEEPKPADPAPAEPPSMGGDPEPVEPDPAPEAPRADAPAFRPARTHQLFEERWADVIRHVRKALRK